MDEVTIATLKVGSVDFFDSQKTQTRHYKTLQEMYKSKKPNKAAVTQLLDLEFQSRRCFIDQKAMKPPNTLNGVEHATAVFKALPLLFPSSTVPPRKLRDSTESFFHVVTTSEDPNGFLRQRPLSCPVVLVSEDNCMIAVGSTPVITFDREDLYEGLLYFMTYYYALHLMYPRCIPHCCLYNKLKFSKIPSMTEIQPHPTKKSLRSGCHSSSDCSSWGLSAFFFLTLV